jgi:hypothetical protein
MKLLNQDPILAKLALKRLDKELSDSGTYHIRCSEHADDKKIVAIRLALIAMVYPVFVFLMFCLSFLFPNSSPVAFFMQCWSIGVASMTFWVTVFSLIIYLIRLKKEKALHESYVEMYDKTRAMLVGRQSESDFANYCEFVRYIENWRDTLRYGEPKRNPAIERSIKTKG